MTIFTVLEPPDDDADKVTLLADGFSVGALIFTVIWALWYRMWVVAACLIASYAALLLAVAAFGLPFILAVALEISLAFLFGCDAHNLRRISLERVGYRPTGVLAASSLDTAELIYFGRKTVTLQRSSENGRLRQYRVEPPDTLGIFGNV